MDMASAAPDRDRVVSREGARKAGTPTGTVRGRRVEKSLGSANKLEKGGMSGTSFATGWGWASRPAKRNENRWDWTECGAGSGEIEINHGAIEAEQLCDPERV
jgi:hypothetical protein